MDEKKTITVQAVINAPVEQVWKLYTEPDHVMNWNNASNDWHTPRAENDLKVGGKFLYRMEAKDGSSGFDFDGTYKQIIANELIVYSISDGRKVEVTFTKDDNARTKMDTTFEAESTNSIEMQRDGWQAILNNFKIYVETRN
ncbi:MAG TPA: SRPBCC family protein [Nitrososphaeraceae archaeon]|nr:SRPBCC family protein [Nitrososphaeraceae archaeon]